jgi:hypothetical protein
MADQLINRSPNKPVQPTWADYSVLPMLASWLQRTQTGEKQAYETAGKEREYKARMDETQAQGQTVMGAQELQNKGAQDLEDRKQAIATLKARIQKAETTYADPKLRAQLQAEIDRILATTPPGISKAAGYHFPEHQETLTNAKKQAWLNGDVDFKSPEEIMVAGNEFGASDEEIRQAIEAHERKKKSVLPAGGLGGGTSQAEWEAQSQGVWNNPNRGVWGKLQDFMKLPLSPQYIDRAQQGPSAQPPTDFNKGMADLYKNVPIIADQLKQQ